MRLNIELEDEELGIVVEALRIQRERWNDMLMKKLANDSSVSEIPLEDIREGLRRHMELLERLPERGLTGL